MRKPLFALPLFLLGCASTSSYVRSDGTTLGRVVVYRNGVAYFERTAEVNDDVLKLSVPADKIDDFLKSLTVTDAKTGQRAPVDFQWFGRFHHRLHRHEDSPRRQRAPPSQAELRDRGPRLEAELPVMLSKDGKVDAPSLGDCRQHLRRRLERREARVGASSAISFRFDLEVGRFVQRETLHERFFAQAPPMGGSTYGQSPEARSESSPTVRSPPMRRSRICARRPRR